MGFHVSLMLVCFALPIASEAVPSKGVSLPASQFESLKKLAEDKHQSTALRGLAVSRLLEFVETKERADAIKSLSKLMANSEPEEVQLAATNLLIATGGVDVDESNRIASALSDKLKDPKTPLSVTLQIASGTAAFVESSPKTSLDPATTLLDAYKDALNSDTLSDVARAKLIESTPTIVEKLLSRAGGGDLTGVLLTSLGAAIANCEYSLPLRNLAVESLASALGKADAAKKVESQNMFGKYDESARTQLLGVLNDQCTEDALKVVIINTLPAIKAAREKVK